MAIAKGASPGINFCLFKSSLSYHSKATFLFVFSKRNQRIPLAHIANTIDDQ